jgi:hypothetical protein
MSLTTTTSLTLPQNLADKRIFNKHNHPGTLTQDQSVLCTSFKEQPESENYTSLKYNKITLKKTHKK